MTPDTKSEGANELLIISMKTKDWCRAVSGGDGEWFWFPVDHIKRVMRCLACTVRREGRKRRTE